MPKHTQTAAEYITQLQEIAAAHAEATNMKPGQFVRRRDCTLPIHLRDGNVGRIGVIIEIVPNMRELTGEVGDYSGPAAYIGVIAPDGGYQEVLLEVWQYRPVSSEEIAALLGQTSH